MKKLNRLIEKLSKDMSIMEVDKQGNNVITKIRTLVPGPGHSKNAAKNPYARSSLSDCPLNTAVVKLPLEPSSPNSPSNPNNPNGQTVRYIVEHQLRMPTHVNNPDNPI